MKKIRICVLVLAVVASGSRFVMAQAPAPEAAK